MFWGEFTHQLDKKGRLIIPARYRDFLNNNAILTRGIDGNLVIYPQNAWRGVSEQLNQLSIANPAGRGLRRLLFSGAVEVALDRQGRVLIPLYLRQYASLETEVLIVGMETYIEIWHPERWRKALDELSDTLADAEALLKF